MTSPLWRHRVTWRHQEHAQSIAHGHFPIGCPLEQSRYLAEILRYLAPKLQQRLLHDDVINGRHLGFSATGSRSIRSAIPENHTLGSNMKSIRRSIAEIWPFETLNLMTSLMTSQGIHYPWGTLIFPRLGTIVLKYQLIPTRTVGEEAFWKCGQTDILTSW